MLAPAGASRAGASPAATHPGPHACVCGMSCKGACCCARRAATRPGPAPEAATPATPAAVRTRAAADPAPAPESGGGPCLASAPCGGLPATPAPSPRLQGRVLDMTPPAPRPQPPAPGALVRADRPALRSAATPEPADDPPEPAAR